MNYSDVSQHDEKRGRWYCTASDRSDLSEQRAACSVKYQMARKIPIPAGANLRLRSFAELSGTNWTTGRTLIEALRPWRDKPSDVVLDLGCGTSPFREFFPAAAYCGFDRGAGADVVADICSIPARTGCADIVLLFHALGDVENPSQALGEVRRVLKPGGRVLILESTCYPPHDLPYDFYRFMPNGLISLASREGLKLDKLTWLGGLFTRFASLINKFLLARVILIPGMTFPARALIVLVNVLCAMGDGITRSERLAESYLAELVHAD
jgi:SAM-dependent methyltransferase